MVKPKSILQWDLWDPQKAKIFQVTNVDTVQGTITMGNSMGNSIKDLYPEYNPSLPPKDPDGQPRLQGLRKKVVWRSPDGSMVGVEGPIPPGIYRSDCVTQLHLLGNLTIDDLFTHESGIRNPNQFVLMLAEDVEDTSEPESNEWGEICP